MCMKRMGWYYLRHRVFCIRQHCTAPEKWYFTGKRKRSLGKSIGEPFPRVSISGHRNCTYLEENGQHLFCRWLRRGYLEKPRSYCAGMSEGQDPLADAWVEKKVKCSGADGDEFSFEAFSLDVPYLRTPEINISFAYQCHGR